MGAGPAGEQGGLTRSRGVRLQAHARAAAVSRVYSGVHFPMDGEEGLNQGASIAPLALERIDAVADRFAP